MQYFSRFIPRFGDLASILYDQTKDDAPPWTEACTTAWNSLRTCLQRATLMHHTDFRLPFHVYFHASLCGVGGILMQERDSIMYPIAYCTRKLTSAEINYITTEQEFLAMVYCLALLS
jgi:hypothetical protein